MGPRDIRCMGSLRLLQTYKAKPLDQKPFMGCRLSLAHDKAYILFAATFQKRCQQNLLTEPAELTA